MSRTVRIALLVTAVVAVAAGLSRFGTADLEGPASTAISPTCGTLRGQSPEDLDNLHSFCARAVVAGEVTRASADDEALRLHVAPAVAEAWRESPGLTTRRVRAWVRNWLDTQGDTGGQVVVHSDGQPIAVGDHSFVHGEEVRIP